MVIKYEGVKFVCDAEIPREEAEAYIIRGFEKCGKNLYMIEAHVDGEDIELKYFYENKVPFDRIRRITGYLVGTLDRFNDAKRSEESERVKHDLR